MPPLPNKFLTFNGEYKFCPLCQCHIGLFFINFTDEIIMCENEMCDFPFQYEDPIILEPGDQLDEGYGISFGMKHCCKPPCEAPIITRNTTNDSEMAVPSRFSTQEQKITSKTPESDDEKVKECFETLESMKAELNAILMDVHKIPCEAYSDIGNATNENGIPAPSGISNREQKSTSITLESDKEKIKKCFKNLARLSGGLNAMIMDLIKTPYEVPLDTGNDTNGTEIPGPSRCSSQEQNSISITPESDDEMIKERLDELARLNAIMYAKIIAIHKALNEAPFDTSHVTNENEIPAPSRLSTKKQNRTFETQEENIKDCFEDVAKLNGEKNGLKIGQHKNPCEAPLDTSNAINETELPALRRCSNKKNKRTCITPEAKILKPGNKFAEGNAIKIAEHKNPSEATQDTSNATNKTEMPAPSRRFNKKQNKTSILPEKDDKLKKSIKHVARLNAELSLLNDESDTLEQIEGDNRMIKNKKWIKNLYNLHEMSGVQLLRPEEMSLLKKEEPAIDLGELKIDSGNVKNYDMPFIGIEKYNNFQDVDSLTSDNKTEETDPFPISIVKYINPCETPLDTRNATNETEKPDQSSSFNKEQNITSTASEKDDMLKKSIKEIARLNAELSLLNNNSDARPEPSSDIPDGTDPLPISIGKYITSTETPLDTSNATNEMELPASRKRSNKKKKRTSMTPVEKKLKPGKNLAESNAIRISEHKDPCEAPLDTSNATNEIELPASRKRSNKKKKSTSMTPVEKKLKPEKRLAEGNAISIVGHNNPCQAPINTSYATNELEKLAPSRCFEKEHNRTYITLEKDDEKLKQSIKEIARLNAELSLLNDESDTLDQIEGDNRMIKNKKWIKNLYNLQEISGVQLLRPEEMSLLKKEEPAIDLKIDSGNLKVHNMPVIRIEKRNNFQDASSETSDDNGERTDLLLISIGKHRTPCEASLDINNATNDFEMPAPTRRYEKEQKRTSIALENNDMKFNKNIEEIARLNAELSLLNNDSDTLQQIEEDNLKIQNEKWIKNLYNAHEMSGIQLLRPEELIMLKKEEPEIGFGESKIDSGNIGFYDMPTISIEKLNNIQDPTPETSDDNPEGTDPLPISIGKHMTPCEALHDTSNATNETEMPASSRRFHKEQITTYITSENNDIKLKKNIEEIAKLNAELSLLNNDSDTLQQTEEDNRRIKYEKWIKNLYDLQEMYGVQLLRPEELSLLEKKKPVIGSGELTIQSGIVEVYKVPTNGIEIHNNF
ncbi:hypothetical protein O0L34_g2267 [Tuta absoluta]|nr:hypothetical protein O0L34_g2267 [Tuta absoluta]